MTDKKHNKNITFKSEQEKINFEQFIIDFNGTNLGEKMSDLIANYENLKKENENLLKENNDLKQENDNLKQENENLKKEQNQIKTNNSNNLIIENQEIMITKETKDLILSKVSEINIFKLSEIINNGIISNIKKSDSCSKPREKKGISENVCLKIKESWLDYVSDIANEYTNLSGEKLVLGEIRKRCNVNLKTLKIFFDDSDTFYMDKYNITLDASKIDFSKFKNS